MKFIFEKFSGALVATALSILSCCPAPASAVELAEVMVDWETGEMVANPSANLVYVINETDGDLVAISTVSSSVVAHKRFDFSADQAHSFLAQDGSVLFVSVPSARKLYTLNPVTLAQISVVDLDVKIGSFVIPNDGFLYARDGVDSGLVKIDILTGAAELHIDLTDFPYYSNPRFYLSNDGSEFYVDTSASGVDRYATTSGAPTVTNGVFNNTRALTDLSIDDSNGRIYRTFSNSSYLEVWATATQTTTTIPDGFPGPGAAQVTQLPGSNSVWTVLGAPGEGELTEINKQTSAVLREISIGTGNSNFAFAAIGRGQLEITANGKLIYSKSVNTGDPELGVDGYLYNFGFTDTTNPSVAYSPSSAVPFTPANLAASDNSLPNQVELSWDASGRATGYRIYRNTNPNFASASQIGTTTTETEFLDDTTAPYQDYYYWVLAENASGLSTAGHPDQGNPLSPPAAVTSLAATDGNLNQVFLQWQEAPDTWLNRVFRSATNDFSNAVEITNTSSEFYTDNATTQGVLYYYWVRPENPAGEGPLSAVETGHSGDLVPPQSAPAFVNASENGNPIYVSIFFDSVADARSYEILRHTSNDPAQATLIASPSQTSVTDATGDELVTYYYWVRAVNTAGTGPLSPPDTGTRAELPLPRIPPNVTAADGSSYDKVRISWSTGPYTDDYIIYRSTSDSPASATEIGTRDSHYYDDTSAVAGTVYFYWVQGENSKGRGDLSESDSGFVAIPPAPENPPSNVSASDGAHDDHVYVTWTGVATTETYEVFRSLSNDSSTAISLGTTGSSEWYFSDFSAQPAQPYFYWVQASNVSGSSPLSTSDSGFVAVAAPKFVNATNGLFDHLVRITWHSSATANSYHIYRNTGNASASAVEIGSVTAGVLRYEDLSAVPGQNYYYWVEAEAANELKSSFSLSDDGLRSDEPTAGEAFLPIENPRDVVFDAGRNRAYITTLHGVVEVYDTQAKKVLNEEWNTNSNLIGADISSDGQTLIFAQAKSALAPGVGQVGTIDLTTGQISGHQFSLEAGELSPYDIVAVSGDQVIFTSDGTATDSPLRKLDLMTGVISTLPDGGGGIKSVTTRSLLSRTDDRAEVLVHNRTPTNAPFFLFDPATGQFGAETPLPLGYKFGTISPDGALIASTQAPDIDIRNANDGSLVHTISARSSGVAFDPTRPIFYAAHTGITTVYAFSTDDWTQQAIIFDSNYLTSEEEFGAGDLTVNSEGTLLAVQMSSGVLMVQPRQYFETPGPPQNVTATQFTDASGISVNWEAGADATSYTIYRSETNDSTSAAQIAIRPRVVTFVDTDATPDTTYYYWVQSTNHSSGSALSLVASGGRKLSPPSGFSASDDAFTDRVELNWTASPSALSYTILRSETDAIASAAELADEIANTSYQDTTAVPGSVYFYWIKALGNISDSEFSPSDSGSRQIAGPNGVALDTSSSNAVLINWESVSGANLYRVYRGPSTNPAAASLIGETDQLIFADTAASHGQTYFWFVQAATDDYTSGLSSPATGHRIFPAPQNLNVSANLRDQIYLYWSAVASPADRYELRRSLTDDFSASSLVATPSNITYSDTSAPSGVPVHYWLRAMSSTASGEWSQTVQGFRRIDNFSEFTADHGLTGDEALPTADPDEDEFSNFEEWAQGGSDPTDSSSRPPLIPRFQTVSDADYLTISYLRFFGGSENGANYEHDWATYASRGTLDLESVQWPNAPLPSTPPSDLEAAPSGYEWGCARLPMSTDDSALGFMNLLVTPPSP